MLIHYLNAALSHYARHKTTTIINVLCLALGLLCFAVAYGVVANTRSGDLYHAKADRTYIVTQRSEFVYSGSTASALPFTGAAFAPLIEADHPQLEHVARATRGGEMAVAALGEKTFATVSYADHEFLQVFDFEFVAGDRRTALQNPRGAVISDELALRLFGRTDVLDSPLRINNRETVHITGVMSEPRQPSHISFDRDMPVLEFSLLLPMEVRTALLPPGESRSQSQAQFFRQDTFTYVVLPENGSLTIQQLSNDLPRLAQRHVPAEYGHAVLGLRPLSEIAEAMGDWSTKRDRTGISSSAVTLILGALVLTIACLNYANLASAQATTRSREIALRRVVGARFRQIAAQFFAEALLLVLLAALLALAMLPAAAKVVEARMGLDIASVIFRSPSFWTGALVTIVAVALLASCYPIFVTSRIRPAQALPSGRWPVIKRRMMRWLVGLQFVSASFLLISASVMKAQNEHLDSLWESAAGDQIVVIENKLDEMGLDRELIQSELRKHASIRAVSAMNALPMRVLAPSIHVMANADPASRRWMLISPVVDYDFFPTMGANLIAGRLFERSHADDVGESGNIVIDRALASEFGWSAHEALGKQIYVPASAVKSASGNGRRIIGVVENLALFPIAFGSSSTMYRLDPNEASVLLVRLSAGDVRSGIAAIDAVWNRLAPDVPLKRTFLDEQVERTARVMSIYTFAIGGLAVFSLLVAAMGLVGIATQAIAQRAFELGVRKALGATGLQLFFLLLKDFSKPILIANLIAWPLAFVLAKGYSAAFVQKAPLSLTPFVLTLMLGLAIGWLAVLVQATRAARVSPAKVLRYE